MNGHRVMTAMLLLCCAGCIPTLQAQLTGDPAGYPLPGPALHSAGRAVVVSVRFNSATDVVPTGVKVARTPVRNALGEAPHLLLELLDAQGRVIGARESDHPLEVRDWDVDGNESGSALPDGPGTFYVPLAENLAAVRIRDLRLDQELLTVDVAAEVQDYCAANGGSPICVIFRDGFE